MQRMETSRLCASPWNVILDGKDTANFIQSRSTTLEGPEPHFISLQSWTKVGSTSSLNSSKCLPTTGNVWKSPPLIEKQSFTEHSYQNYQERYSIEMNSSFHRDEAHTPTNSSPSHHQLWKSVSTEVEDLMKRMENVKRVNRRISSNLGKCCHLIQEIKCDMAPIKHKQSLEEQHENDKPTDNLPQRSSSIMNIPLPTISTQNSKDTRIFDNSSRSIDTDVTCIPPIPTRTICLNATQMPVPSRHIHLPPRPGYSAVDTDTAELIRKCEMYLGSMNLQLHPSSPSKSRRRMPSTSMIQ